MRILAGALACVVAAPFLLIVLYRFVDPPVSALMLRQTLSGRKVTHKWRPLEQISPELRVAVLVSEDAQFCRHWGVDWRAVGQALGAAEDGGKLRGASTIPMQTVKNLFLWPGRDYARKIAEAPLAYFMSLVWPKDRVMEVYLNIVEWGPGVFGAEAAARRHFHKPASRLNGYEAAALAASLPNPIKRRAGHPGPQTYRLIRRLRRRVAVERGQARCVVERADASGAASAKARARKHKAEAPEQKRRRQQPTRIDFWSRDFWRQESWLKDRLKDRPRDQGGRETASQDRKAEDREGWSGGRWDEDRWDKEERRDRDWRERDGYSRDRASRRERDWSSDDPYDADYNSRPGSRWSP
jgi:monofunctional biosynthetic peptidoglycan transglycosylase